MSPMIPVLENSQDFFRLCQIIVILDQRDIPERQVRRLSYGWAWDCRVALRLAMTFLFFKIFVAIGAGMV